MEVLILYYAFSFVIWKIYCEFDIRCYDRNISIYWCYSGIVNGYFRNYVFFCLFVSALLQSESTIHIHTSPNLLPPVSPSHPPYPTPLGGHKTLS